MAAKPGVDLYTQLLNAAAIPVKPVQPVKPVPTYTYGAYFEEALYFATLEASSGNSGGINTDAEWDAYAAQGSMAAASWN